MLPIAGQTARLNGLNFFVEIPNFFQHFSYLLFYLFFKINGQRQALQLVKHI